jgi:drug/metabolite transporter (DMT)-like permease
MGALVKLAGARLPSQEIVFARAVVALVLSFGLLRRAGVPLLGQNRPLLLLRGVFGFLGLSCVFYAVSHLPLAEATVIQYLHPVFTALLAFALLGEAVGRRLLASLALSFVGMLLVARPAGLLGLGTSDLDSFAVAVAVAGAFFSACAYVVVRRLSAHENALVIVFYFPLVTVPATLPTLLTGSVWPRGLEWALLLGVGVMAQIGQVALTRGMALEPAARATALSYLQVAFAAALGVLVFGEVPDAWVLAGALSILVGAYLTSRS